ncbi:autotransporter assembly complex protein TamA [Derxia lacustris]|uniref:autotransporter assembly complex protein TamA n=1 Tax=Derxia lacustris TaxID=764842 RepID=UPI000A173F09|nr:autotransporter assembly complex family protein [Derxia lacustris]
MSHPPYLHRAGLAALVCAALATAGAHAESATPLAAPAAETEVSTAPVVQEPLPGRALRPGERRRVAPVRRSATPVARAAAKTPAAPGAAPALAAADGASSATPAAAVVPPSAAPVAAAPAPVGAAAQPEGAAAAPAGLGANQSSAGGNPAVAGSPPASAGQTAASTSPAEPAGARPAAARPARRDFDFTLEAPDELRELLLRHLDLAKGDYDEDGIDRDRLDTLIERAERQARGLLTTEGYFSPRLDTRVDGEARPWRVTMTVEAGPATRVAEVSISVVGASEPVAQRFYDEHRVAAHWTLREGDRFRQEDWDRSKDALLRAFLVEEFPEARYARTEARIDPATRQARLEVELDAGPPRYFGAAHVTGLTQYPPEIIEIQNRIKPGAPYSQVALLETQSRLQVLPYFRNVTVTADLDAADADGRVPVNIAVEEAQTRKFLIGPGFSSNSGARVQAGYSDVNINGAGWRFDSLARIEQREQLARAGITLPDRPDGYRDSITNTFLHSNVSGLELRASSLLLRHGRDEQALRSIDRAYTLLYAYSIEKPSGADRRLNRALAPGVAWTYRRIDNLAYPREGVIGNLQLAGGLHNALSDEDFVRGYAKVVGFLPVGERDSLTVRLEGGAVLTATPSNVPEMLRFRAGGDQSIRGYAYQSIGQTEGTATVGARYLAIGGVEATHWLSSEWGVGVFAETGDAFNTAAGFVPHTGVGFGPRWRSPIGPLNFDLAYGVRAHQVRLHFSLGFVF